MQYRMKILILATLFISVLFGNTLILNFTIISMTSNRTVSEGDNGTITKILPPELSYSSSEKARLLSAVAIGALVALPLFTVANQKIGLKTTLLTIGCLSSVSTALCPLAARMGYWWFIAARIVQGSGYAACMPAVGAVTAAWAAGGENGLFTGALTSFIQLAPVLVMPLAGLLCSLPALGWPPVFYAMASLTAVVTAGWWWMYSDSPSCSSRVSEEECAKITGKGGASRDENKNIPFSSIYSSLPVWAVWIAAIGNMYSIQMVIVFAPTYISQVHHLSLVNVGMLSAAPTLLQFGVKMLAGWSSDRIRWIKENAKIRVFNSLAFVGMAGCLVVLSLSAASTPLALAALIATAAVLGFNTGGFFKSPPLIARHHASFVNAHVQVIMCVSMLTVPFLVYALTPNGTADEWALVFRLHAGLLFLTNAVFCVLGEGEPQPWALTEEEKRKEEVAV